MLLQWQVGHTQGFLGLEDFRILDFWLWGFRVSRLVLRYEVLRYTFFGDGFGFKPIETYGRTGPFPCPMKGPRRSHYPGSVAEHLNLTPAVPMLPHRGTFCPRALDARQLSQALSRIDCGISARQL